ncbi:flagellar basal body rod protein FlgC [Sinanaerobacter sp. ZZT-01]|uniref:flagellar basal body rod protein FlgC n=1 Tax=Sinanaerobacter sp. ZZT-01 TaxID=3111540 RepID=UPI002D76AFFD|nr:flagellar basal body rod protein FlgC [Sinanaerobacter sp. ZZT-01]WRR93610.1 flagellar basal body rod protein FlgC [Sinanaerobacter sp. ZZT-01]
MAFLNTLNINGSALTAQRLRLSIISENLTNRDTTRTESGGPYRRKTVAFEAIEKGDFKSLMNRALGKQPASGNGVGGVRVSEIIEDESPFKTVYDPTHPDADERGYVNLPNVNILQETIDAMSASRSYEANVTAINAVKLMASKALEVGK